jgi:rubrerythrin
MEFKTLRQIVDYAIEREKEAAAFYEEVSEMEYASGSRQMFKDFAAEERKHRKLLENIEQKGIADSLEDYEFKWIKDIKRSNYAVDIEYERGMPYNEMLMLAMKREEKAPALYNDLLRQAETADQKKIFKMLCQEEAKHKLALETMYDDYMAEMGD